MDMFHLLFPTFQTSFKSYLDDAAASLLYKACSAFKLAATTTCFLLLRGCILCLGVLGLMLIAVVCYALLLQISIPIIHQSAPVQLYTEGRCGIHSCKQGKLDVGEAIIFQRESYQLRLLLELPESETNFQLGNFDVLVTFSGNVTVRGSVNSIQGIIRYRSPLVRMTRTVLMIAFYVLGIWDESQEVTVQMNTAVLDNVKTAEIQICPKELQVYSASVQVEAMLTGLRGFVARHPYVSAVCGVMTIFTLEILGVLLMLLKRRNRWVSESFAVTLRPLMIGEYQKPTLKQLTYIEPLKECDPVTEIPRDFSHLLLPEPVEKSWFATLKSQFKTKAK